MKLNPLLTHRLCIKNSKKGVQIMKLSIVIMFVCVCQLFAATGKAQDAIVQLPTTRISIGKLFKEIEKQTDYLVVYSSSQLDPDMELQLKKKSAKVSDYLDEALSESDLTYKFTNNYIILSNAEKLPQIQQGKKQITGVVTDQNGEPIIGANVIEKGTTNGTVTDLDGSYSLTVPEKATLEVTYIGYNPSLVLLTGKTPVNIQLAENTQTLDEVVVIGYGTQKKASLTGSISSVKIDDEKRSISSSNLSSVLAGTMSGLRINNRTGVPGVSSEVAIRTGGSWNDTKPVYVIDGVVREKTDFDRLDVNEVENITILKDAASAAIYGSRASGGVVLITTKQGHMGKPQIRYTGSYAIEARGMEMDVTSGVETAELANYMHRKNMSHWTTWDEKELEHIRNLNNGEGYDWVKENWTSPTSTHHALSLSGGNDRVKYFINGSYFGQNAFLKNIDYSRYNIRANVEAAVHKNMKIIAQVSSSYGKKNNITYGEGTDDLSGIYQHLYCFYPEGRPRTSDGKPTDWGWIGNIGEFTNLDNSGYNRSEDQVSETLLRMEYSVPFIKGLKAKAQFAYNYKNDYNKTFKKKQTLYQVKREGTNGHIWTDEVIGVVQSAEPGKEFMSQVSNRNKSYQLNLQLDYTRTFGKHDLSLLAVYEQKEGWVRDFKGGREIFPILVKDQWFATSSARNDSWVDGSEAENGRLSYIGQVNYGYDNKYLLNASLRVDGSMNFPKGKQYGYFPAVSGAWVISRENFFQSEKIQLLKMRASVGLTGNDDIIGWQWQESYKAGTSAFLGTSPSTHPGIQFGGVVNPFVTWEKSLSYNIGADLYWSENLTFSADYWNRNTYDILGERKLSIPTSFGFVMPKENYGEMHATGLDFEIGYKNKIRHFNYYVKGIFSYSTNKVKVKDYAADSPDYDNPVGRPWGYIKGYRDAGIIRTQQELDDLTNQYKQLYGSDHQLTVFGNKPEKGMLMYEDLSGPLGTPDGKIDSYDQDMLSKYSTPPFSAGLTLGFEWKGISFETLFQGDFGYKRGLDSRYLNMIEWNRMPKKWLDHWSEENPNGYFPDPKASDEFKSYNAISTFTIHDASFVKMRYINLGYTFPKSMLSPLNFIGSARVFCSATNLLTITTFDFWDPELPTSGSYPNMKTFNFGLDVTF